MSWDGVRAINLRTTACTDPRVAQFRDLLQFLTRYYSTNMDPIELAIEHLTLQDTKNLSTTTKLFNVDRSTLSRRWNGVSNPASMAQENSRFLNAP